METTKKKRGPGRPKGSGKKKKDTSKLGHITPKGRVKLNFSMAERMKDILGLKAYKVHVVKLYAEQVGIDSHTATVMDCLIHCQLQNALTGSAPHIAQIWDRIDGKVTQETKVNVSGKLSMTEAIQAMKLGDRVTEEE